MRHKKTRFQLNRFTSWRKATLVNLAKNLLIYQSIKTSLAKAKATRILVEKLILLAKNNGLSAKRQAARILNDHKLVSLLFNEIGPRFAKRQTGFTRIINLGSRRGDNSQMAVLELIEIKQKKLPKKEKGEKEEIKKLIEQKKTEEKRPEVITAVKEKPPIIKKPTKKFLGGLRSIFKKERDSL